MKIAEDAVHGHLSYSCGIHYRLLITCMPEWPINTVTNDILRILNITVTTQAACPLALRKGQDGGLLAIRCDC